MRPIYAIRGEFPGGEFKWWNDQHKTWEDDMGEAEFSSCKKCMEDTVYHHDNTDPEVWGPWVCEISVVEVEL